MSSESKIFNIKKKLIIEYANTIIVAVFLALLFKSLVCEQYKVPTPSMVPTIMDGDRLLISKYKYGYSKYSFPLQLDILKGRFFFKEPERGDIIVFKVEDGSVHYLKKLVMLPVDLLRFIGEILHIVDESTQRDKDDPLNYVKRLIGLPGDTVQVIDSVLYINDESVARKKVGTLSRTGDRGENTIFDVYEETLPNGRKYNVMQHPRYSRALNGFDEDNTPRYKVPNGYYFFMGDNRNHSADSRYLNDLGYVPEEKLIGRVELVVLPGDFSFKKFFLHFDIGRMFMRLGSAN